MTGVVPLTAFAGAVAPSDIAGTDVPAIAGKNFSAVAEVHSSADGDEGVPLVIRASEQWRAVVELGPVRPGNDCSSPGDYVTLPEPIEHSVAGMPNEVGSSSVDSIAVPVPIEHSGGRETDDMPSSGQPMTHSDISGDGKMVGRIVWVLVIHPGTFRWETSGSHRRMTMQL